MERGALVQKYKRKHRNETFAGKGKKSFLVKTLSTRIRSSQIEWPTHWCRYPNFVFNIVIVHLIQQLSFITDLLCLGLTIGSATL